jgi:hypothetical protein
MPGAYPEWLLDTPEKRDFFWNLRLGVLVAPLVVLLALLILASSVKTLSVLVVISTMTIYAWMKLVFAYNVFGRLMSRIKWLEDD